MTISEQPGADTELVLGRDRAAVPVGGPETLGIVLDRASGVALYRQIERQVRDLIADGTVKPNTRLPAERALAAALSVDRTTIVAAYRELASGGIVVARVGQGTTVVGVPVSSPGSGQVTSAALTVTRLAWDERFAPRADEDPVLDDISVIASRPDVISLASGIPAPETYPTADFRRLLDEALGEGGEGFLQYCPPEGLESLRIVLAERMRRRGIRAQASNVLVCAGSQQGLYLLARALIEPGDVVAVEAPTYLGALQVFRGAGARIITIPSDREGVDPERFHEMLGRRQIKLVYLLPTFQNPSGGTLSRSRRERIVEIVAHHGVPVIEDDPYGELRYSGEDVPTLAAIAGPAGPVIYLSTFSKMLFPGFRLGWVAAPETVIGRLSWEKSLVDLDSNPLAQWAVSSYAERGMLGAHLQMVRQMYPARRDALAGALEHVAGEQLTWRNPEGGFYIWAHLAGGMRSREVLAEASRAGVTFVPGDLFHADGGGRSAMRLAFSSHPPPVLEDAADRLAAAIQHVSARSGRTRRSSPTRIV